MLSASKSYKARAEKQAQKKAEKIAAKQNLSNQAVARSDDSSAQVDDSAQTTVPAMKEEPATQKTMKESARVAAIESKAACDVSTDSTETQQNKNLLDQKWLKSLLEVSVSVFVVNADTKFAMGKEKNIEVKDLENTNKTSSKKNENNKNNKKGLFA